MMGPFVFCLATQAHGQLPDEISPKLCVVVGRVIKYSRGHLAIPMEHMFSWRTKPCEGVVLTRHHWAKDLLDAGHRPGRKSSQTNYNDLVFATKASHLDGGHRLWSGMERDGLRHATSALDTPHDDDNHYTTHTGSAVARVTKGRAFCWIPGRR